MEKINIPLEKLVYDATQYLAMQSYSAVTIYNYNRIWRHLLKYANEKHVEYFTMEFGLEFLFNFEKIKSITMPSKLEKSKLRIIKVLNDLLNGIEPKRHYCCTPVRIPISFIEESNKYKRHLIDKGQRDRTVESKLFRIKIFFTYLEKQSISLQAINFDVICGFYRYLSKKYATNYKSNIQFTLRDFLCFSEDNGTVTEGTSHLTMTIYSNKHERLPSTYNCDEINSILQAVDRSTRYGKRDYAILMLAVQLGMRTADICHLQIDCIQWNTNTITFRQQKTYKQETLPLTELLVYALADYIKNARPDTCSELLFVYLGANSGHGYTSSSLYAIVNKYMKKADVSTSGKRHGLHTMRHSLASSLLKEGTPLPVITGVLGHSNTEITKRYLWMDTEQLRLLALEVPYEK
ncbi:MAG: site-specific integrase [Desulfosporosinus sp.]